MHRLSLVSFSILVVCLGFFPSAEANLCRRFLSQETAQTEPLGPTVPWDQLIPGQTHFGQYIVEKYDFKRPIKTIETPQAFILNKNIPVVEVQISEGSRYFMVDSHHTLLRFVNMFSQEKKKSLLVPIRVVETITATRFDYQLMQRLVDQGHAWTPDVLTPLWRLSTHWPQNILELRDLPLRSAVQILFFEMDLSGKSFKPYMQFYLAEELRQQGFKIKSKDFESAKREAKLKKRLHKFLIKTPEVLEALKQNIVEDDTKGALTKISNYQTLRTKK